jgi:hypothetical protein
MGLPVGGEGSGDDGFGRGRQWPGSEPGVDGGELRGWVVTMSAGVGRAESRCHGPVSWTDTVTVAMPRASTVHQTVFEDSPSPPAGVVFVERAEGPDIALATPLTASRHSEGLPYLNCRVLVPERFHGDASFGRLQVWTGSRARRCRGRASTSPAERSDALALHVITLEARPAPARVFGSVAEATEQLEGPRPELPIGGQE